MQRLIVVEAIQYRPHDNCSEVAAFMDGGDDDFECEETENDEWAINTLEGTMWAQPGDWIIKGLQGEFYTCNPDIFEDTYELVGDQDTREMILNKLAERLEASIVELSDDDAIGYAHITCDLRAAADYLRAYQQLLGVIADVAGGVQRLQTAWSSVIKADEAKPPLLKMILKAEGRTNELGYDS
jgi:hypothetical protein